MKEFSRIWWGVVVTLLGVANVMLFVYMMLMYGLVSRPLLYPMLYLLYGGFLFSYYAAAPAALFGFVCAIGCSMAGEVSRAKLLSALSGGALFSAILVWAFFHL